MEDAHINSITELDLSDLKFPLFVVYRERKEKPWKYSMRVFDVMRPTNAVMIKDTLAEIQSDIMQNSNKVFCTRHRDDDPSIVGTWI